MKTYLVTWQINVDDIGAQSPEDVAKLVWNKYFAHSHIANVFTLQDEETKEIFIVDLDETGADDYSPENFNLQSE